MQLTSIEIFPGLDKTTEVTVDGAREISIRVAHEFDALAAALRSNMSVAVSVQDGAELPLPVDGVLYICRPDVLDRSVARWADRVHHLASRTVAIEMVRTYALKTAEELALAAAIETEQYFWWRAGRNAERPSAFYGLKRVGRLLGATWSTHQFQEGDDYALLSHPELCELPGFLAAYLEIYAGLL